MENFLLNVEKKDYMGWCGYYCPNNELVKKYQNYLWVIVETYCLCKFYLLNFYFVLEFTYNLKFFLLRIFLCIAHIVKTKNIFKKGS